MPVTITSAEIRERFLNFFRRRGHAILPSASLIPENDPTVLFNTAGMQPLVPYLLGETHPMGKRLANSQKCVRLTDIDEVGDQNHLTFFEMLGNWSLGDYFKSESIEWSMDFLTSKEYGLGLDPIKIYITVFSGETESDKDIDSIVIWKKIFAIFGIDARIYGEEDLEPTNKKLKPLYKIFPLGKGDNWWPTGGKNPGPQGPDTEIFYYWGQGLPNLEKERPGFNDSNFWEIWNNVFMEFQREGEGYQKLSQLNVDTGMGLERALAVISEEKDVFKNDSFRPIIQFLETEYEVTYGKNEEETKALRIIADHLRAAVFILGEDDKIVPSNLGQGYVLRRLIRRSLRYQRKLSPDNKIRWGVSERVARILVDNYAQAYDNLARNFTFIIQELKKEETRFEQTLERGLKEWEKIAQAGKINGQDIFKLFSTYGFPTELTEELAKERGVEIDEKGLKEAIQSHHEASRKGAEEHFKGGLLDTSEETTKLHSATHLLQTSLRKVLGIEVEQKGSNITPDRLRFDFSFSRKLECEELKKVEEMVNEAIKSSLPVTVKEMSYPEAIKIGALGFFKDRYGDKVKVYTFGSVEAPFSQEICNGPHVNNTSELGHFKILKEEASSAGVRRIKAILE